MNRSNGFMDSKRWNESGSTSIITTFAMADGGSVVVFVLWWSLDGLA